MHQTKMPFARFLFCLCVLLFTCHLGTTNAKSFFKLGSRAASCQIVVDHSGHGNFSSIQSAIDNIPSNNKNWVCIFIKAGIYRYIYIYISKLFFLYFLLKTCFDSIVLKGKARYVPPDPFLLFSIY